METNSNPGLRAAQEHHGEIILRIPSIPPQRENLTDRSWPFFGSFALHSALFVLFFQPIFNYPEIISSQTPAVLWFSLTSFPDSRDDTTEKTADLLQPPLQSGNPPDQTESVHITPETPPTTDAAALTIATPPSTLKKIKTAALINNPPVSISNDPVPKAVPAKSFAVPLKAEPDVQPTLKVQEPAVPTTVRSQPPGVTVQGKDVPIVTNRSEQGQTTVKNESHTQEKAEVPARKESPRIAALTKAEPVKPTNAARQNDPSQPSDKTKSLSLPLVTGDLKIVLTGAVFPETTITFKKFALSRRNRPLSRVESLQRQKVIPLITNTQDNTREFFISKTGQGIYAIALEPAKEASSVGVVIRLYEGTPRATTKDLGRIAITSRKVVFRILMPEGIYWDDAAAFSGSLEDSEGVTKFNTASGLLWREYSD